MLTGFDLTPDAERFFAKVDVGDCWTWTAAAYQGYGQFHIQGRLQKAHRVAWQLLVGEIPAGLQLDHLCKNPRCVNPDHLEPVTPRVNSRRSCSASVSKARAMRQTHCINGHPLSGDNLHKRPNGKRECRTCMRERARSYRARKAAA